MEDLYKYLGKRCKVIDANGKVWYGKAEIYTSPLDADEMEGEKENMAFYMDGYENQFIAIDADEIKSIEVINK